MPSRMMLHCGYTQVSANSTSAIGASLQNLSRSELLPLSARCIRSGVLCGSQIMSDLCSIL